MIIKSACPALFLLPLVFTFRILENSPRPTSLPLSCSVVCIAAVKTEITVAHKPCQTSFIKHSSIAAKSCICNFSYDHEYGLHVTWPNALSQSIYDLANNEIIQCYKPRGRRCERTTEMGDCRRDIGWIKGWNSTSLEDKFLNDTNVAIDIEDVGM